MHVFWLSFADPNRPEGSQFLGACLVEALAMELAVPTAWSAGCNPGGEVQIVQTEVARAELEAEGWRLNRLYSLTEIQAFGPAYRIKSDGALEELPTPPAGPPESAS